MSILPGLAALLDGALTGAGLTEAATLTVYTPGTRTTLDPLGGTNPTSTAYTCRGFVAARQTSDRPADQVTAVGDRTVCLMVTSITDGVVPKPGDRVLIDGETSMITAVTRDPAAATWVLTCRGL